MAFSLAFFRPLMTANHIPQRNIHWKPQFKNPNSKPNTHALRSLPLKSFNYESTWSSSLNDEGLSRVEESPSKVRALKCILREGGDDPWESLEVIDALQRLGIDYLFQDEIRAILQAHHEIIISGAPRFRCGDEIDLHKAALRFRLLRQQGYYVRADDVFTSFMDENGNLKEELKQDIKGLTSLYEASKLCIHGEEDILEKAGNLSKQILEATTATNDSDNDLGKFVSHTLGHPHHISPSAFMVKKYFGDLQWMNKWISIFQQVAKVEFNATQALHQKEIIQLSKWDIGAATEELPDCMKLCLAVLYEVTNEISDVVVRKHGNNPTESLRKTWEEQCKGFLVQAEWLKSGKWATADEYLKNGIITCGFPLGLIHAFHLLGEGLSPQTVDLLHTCPDIVSSSATILRLLDDIEALQGGEDGYDASYIEYYMKEHQDEGISIESTREHVEKLISDAWKTLNAACLLPNNPFPQKFIHSSINTVRIFHLISESKSDQSSQNLKKLMASVLFESVDTQ